MKKDALTTLKNASEIMLKMGFSKEEISALLFDGGRKSFLVLDDAVDVMTLYFRAQKLLSDKYVMAVLAESKDSRYIKTLQAVESFVDTLDKVLVLQNVGSGKQESIRTWENYFTEKEDKFVRDMKNKGKATRRQKDTYEAIKANPYDSRIKTYLKDYLDEQTMKDIVFAINDDANALVTVKGLPFALGKSKQESYADVALKFLYADSQISRYQEENLKLKDLNKSLSKRIAEIEAKGQPISTLEAAIMAAIAKGNKLYLDALESSKSDIAKAIVDSRDILLASNDDIREGLAAMIITNGKARKNEHELQNKAHNQQHAEHKEQLELLNAIEAKLAKINSNHASFDKNNEELAKQLIRLKVVVAAAGVSARTLADAKSELAAIEISNGRARKREHAKQNAMLGKINKKTTVAATLAGLALAAGIAGATIGMVSNQPSDEAKAYKDYAAVENAEFVDFQALLNELNAGGLTEDEEKQLLAKIEEYSKTDNAELGMPSTTSMKAILSATKNENALNDLTAKYSQVVAEYEALKNFGSVSTFNYVEVLNKMVSISERLAESLNDNNLTAEEKAAINAELMALSTIKDDVAKQMADKFGVNLNVVMDSIDYQVASLKNQVADLNNTLDEMKAQKIADDALIASQAAKITELSNTIKTLEEQLANSGTDADLAKELATAKAELASAKAKIAELEAQNKSLSLQVTSLTSEVSRLKGIISTLENAAKVDDETIASLNAIIDGLESKISDLENQLANSGDAALKTELEKAKSDLAAANAKIAELEAANATLSNKVSSLRSDVADLKSEISSLKTENANLTSEVAGYVKQIAELNANYDKAIADYNNKVAEYNSLLEQYNALLNSGDSAKIAQLEAALQEKGEELNAANAQINALNNEVASLESQVTDLVNQLAASDSGFMRELYTKLTGKSADGLSISEIRAYLEDAFDIGSGNQNSGALGDEGTTPER